MSVTFSWRITRTVGAPRVWAVYDIEAYDRDNGSACGPRAKDPSVRFTADTEAECQAFIDSSEALARVEEAIATAPNSALRDALIEERGAIRQQINEARAATPATAFGG